MFQGNVSIVSKDGKIYELTLDEQKACEGPSDWHGPGDPSSWLCAKIFSAAKSKTNDRDLAFELGAKALGIPVEKLRSTVEWHVNYMRWHDGDDSYDL
jgi:hypothetical protein